MTYKEKCNKVVDLVQNAMRQQDLAHEYHQMSLAALDLANEYIEKAKKITAEELIENGEDNQYA